jgi:hypothetical protein
MIQFKVSTIVIVVVFGFLLCLGGGYYLGYADKSRSSEMVINDLNSVINGYVYQVGELEKKIQDKDDIIQSLKNTYVENELLKQEINDLEDSHLSEVNALQTDISMLQDSIDCMLLNIEKPKPDPCPPVDDNPVLYLPFIFGEQNEFLDIKGEFNETGALSMDIKVPLSIKILVTKHKGEYEVEVAHDNPYVIITGIQVN